jgi:hypothetical protein
MLAPCASMKPKFAAAAPSSPSAALRRKDAPRASSRACPASPRKLRAPRCAAARAASAPRPRSALASSMRTSPSPSRPSRAGSHSTAESRTSSVSAADPPDACISCEARGRAPQTRLGELGGLGAVHGAPRGLHRHLGGQLRSTTIQLESLRACRFVPLPWPGAKHPCARARLSYNPAGQPLLPACNLKPYFYATPLLSPPEPPHCSNQRRACVGAAEGAG